MESLIRTARTYSYFFLLYKWYKSDLQIVPFISDHSGFMSSADAGRF